MAEPIRLRPAKGGRRYVGSRCIEASARRYPSLISASLMHAASLSSCLRLASSTVLAMCLMTWLRAARIASSAPMASIITVTSDLLAARCEGAFSIAQGGLQERTRITRETTHV